METVIILGAGQFGRGAARLLNQENMALLAFGDNNPALHQLTESCLLYTSYSSLVSTSRSILSFPASRSSTGTPEASMAPLSPWSPV